VAIDRLPPLPLREPMLDTRLNSLSRPWIEWFRKAAEMIASGLQEPATSDESQIQSALYSLIDGINTRLETPDTVAIHHRLEALEKRVPESQVPLLNRIENLEKALELLPAQTYPNLPFYLGKLIEINQDGILSFNGTARIGWNKYTANGVTLTKGGSTDVVADLQTASDGNIYHVDEVNDNPPIDLRVDFANVTAFNWVNIIGAYKGITSHMVGLEIEITPFDGSAWYNYSCMDHHGTLDFLEDYSFFIPDDSIHINAGVVTVRFLHSGTTGSTQHDMEIDVVALYQ